jgi:hypothetical protein
MGSAFNIRSLNCCRLNLRVCLSLTTRSPANRPSGDRSQNILAWQTAREVFTQVRI